MGIILVSIFVVLGVLAIGGVAHVLIYEFIIDPKRESSHMAYWRKEVGFLYRLTGKQERTRIYRAYGFVEQKYTQAEADRPALSGNSDFYYVPLTLKPGNFFTGRLVIVLRDEVPGRIRGFNYMMHDWNDAAQIDGKVFSSRLWGVEDATWYLSDHELTQREFDELIRRKLS